YWLVLGDMNCTLAESTPETSSVIVAVTVTAAESVLTSTEAGLAAIAVNTGGVKSAAAGALGTWTRALAPVSTASTVSTQIRPRAAAQMRATALPPDPMSKVYKAARRGGTAISARLPARLEIEIYSVETGCDGSCDLPKWLGRSLVQRTCQTHERVAPVTTANCRTTCRPAALR